MSTPLHAGALVSHMCPDCGEYFDDTSDQAAHVKTTDCPKICNCGSGERWQRLYDAQGIYCGRYCSQCEAELRAKFRPEILSGYDQSDVDEPIEGDC